MSTQWLGGRNENSLQKHSANINRMKQGLFNSVQEVIRSSKLFHNQQGRRLLGFNATPCPADWHLPALPESGSQKVKEQVKVSVRTRRMFWEHSVLRIGKQTPTTVRGPNPEFNTPVAERSSTYMSASSSRLLVSAEKEVPKLRSSSSLILNGNHSAAVACFN